MERKGMDMDDPPNNSFFSRSTIDSLSPISFRFVFIFIFLFTFAKIIFVNFQSHGYGLQSEICDVSEKKLDILEIDFAFDSVKSYHKDFSISMIPSFKTNGTNQTITMNYDLEILYKKKYQTVGSLYDAKALEQSPNNITRLLLFYRDTVEGFDQIAVHLSLYSDFTNISAIRFEWSSTTAFTNYLTYCAPFFLADVLYMFFFKAHYSFNYVLNVILAALAFCASFPLRILFGEFFEWYQTVLPLFLSSLFRYVLLLNINHIPDTPHHVSTFLPITFVVRVILSIRLCIYGEGPDLLNTIYRSAVFGEVVLSAIVLGNALKNSELTESGRKLSFLFFLEILNIFLSMIYEGFLAADLLGFISLVQSDAWSSIYIMYAVIFLYLMHQDSSNTYNPIIDDCSSNALGIERK